MGWLSDGSELSTHEVGSDLFQEWLESELVENYIPNSMAKVFAERPDVESDPQSWLELWEDPDFLANQTGGNVSDELFYTINKRVTRPRFGAVESDYTFTLPEGFDNVRGADNIMAVVDRMMNNILQTVVRGYPEDRIRFVMQMDGLKSGDPISMSFMPQRELTVDRIYDMVYKVIQSGTDVRLNNNFKVNVIWVDSSRSLGGGKRKGGGASASGGSKKKRRKGAGKVFNMRDYAKGAKSVINVTTRDKMCLARCLVIAQWREKRATSPTVYDVIRGKNSTLQTAEARKLCEACGVDPDAYASLGDVKRFERYLNRGLESPRYRLVVFSQSHFFTPIYRGANPQAPTSIYLYLAENHYSLITTMKGFLKKDYFCDTCLKGFKKFDRHACALNCRACGTSLCQRVVGGSGERHECDVCHRIFKSVRCFELHLDPPPNRPRIKDSMCLKLHRCTACNKEYKTAEGPHECYTKKCSNCKRTVPWKHKCFMQVLDPPPEKEREFYFFDYECRQETGKHVPNLVVVHDEEGDELVFEGDVCNDEFCEWLFCDERDVEAVAVAHNFGKYDGSFVLRWLLERGVKCAPLMKGGKIISLRAGKVVFIDSLNFLPMALSRLPKTFGLTDVLKKGYFPHFFNTLANQDYVGPIPEAHYYGPNGMYTEARAAFMEWHGKQVRDRVVFDFRKELLEYCRSDVDILRRCCLEFRRLFMEMTDGVDPFLSLTIASACIRVFRTNFLKEDTIGMIPHGGYHSGYTQSQVAQEWLEYEQFMRGHAIRTGRNHLDGEARVCGYAVDGFDEERGVVYEFHGCVFHGCLKCYPSRGTLNPYNQMSMGALYEKTVAKRKKLQENGYVVVERWGCEWDALKEDDEHVKQFVDRLGFVKPLHERDGMFGGRTNAIKLYDVADPSIGKIIEYKDVTSLYPFVNRTGWYPVGHPVIQTADFMPVQDVFGMVKCDVLAPRGLYIPLLPAKICGKLMFPLCRTCAEGLLQERCTHTDAERTMTGVWYTPELHKALELGYVIVKVHEIWHWEEKSNELFKEYVNCFAKKKQEASGWPSGCVSAASREAYVDAYLEHEGVQLDPDAIEFNPGVRSLAKLMLNSFWGKFAQNPVKDKSMYCMDASELYKLLFDDKVEVKNVTFFNDYVAYAVYKEDREFVNQLANANVTIGGFTTSQARLHLYSYLEQLGERVLYFDTDSVVYTTEPGQASLPTGRYFGELTDELVPGDHIVKFVAAGPKNYAYQTLSGQTVCKIRGFTLNYLNAQSLNLEALLDVVTNDPSREIVVTDPSKIVRNHAQREVFTVSQDKRYKLVYDKRVRVQDGTFRTLPYGY